MSTASGPPVNLLAAISVPCGRQPADPANTAVCRRGPKNPGRYSTSLFLNSHSMEEPHSPQIHAGISSVVLGPFHN